jgi:hypothetical protein
LFAVVCRCLPLFAVVCRCLPLFAVVFGCTVRTVRTV